MKWIGAAIGLVLVVVGLILLGLGFGWIGAGAQIASPENVREQYRQAYDDINALNAVASNICIAVKTRDAYPQGSEGWSQNEQTVQAQENNYQRIENHYNAYIHDVFRGKVVRPRDLPDPAPTEAESIAGRCKP